MRARFDRLPLPAVALVVALLALVGCGLSAPMIQRGDPGSVITGWAFVGIVLVGAVIAVLAEARARRRAGGMERLAERRAAVRGERLPDAAGPELLVVLRRAEERARSGAFTVPVVFGALGLWYILAPDGRWELAAVGGLLLVGAVVHFIDGRTRPPRIRRLVEELERRYPADVRAAAAGA